MASARLLAGLFTALFLAALYAMGWLYVYLSMPIDDLEEWILFYALCAVSLLTFSAGFGGASYYLYLQREQCWQKPIIVLGEEEVNRRGR